MSASALGLHFSILKMTNRQKTDSQYICVKTIVKVNEKIPKTDYKLGPYTVNKKRALNGTVWVMLMMKLFKGNERYTLSETKGKQSIRETLLTMLSVYLWTLTIYIVYLQRPDESMPMLLPAAYFFPEAQYVACIYVHSFGIFNLYSSQGCC